MSFVSQLVQEGLTRDEVYELVKIGAVNELDDTYIKLYKVNTLEEWFVDNYCLQIYFSVIPLFDFFILVFFSFLSPISMHVKSETTPPLCLPTCIFSNIIASFFT